VTIVLVTASIVAMVILLATGGHRGSRAAGGAMRIASRAGRGALGVLAAVVLLPVELLLLAAIVAGGVAFVAGESFWAVEGRLSEVAHSLRAANSVGKPRLA
jgi:hypothetical protein